MTDYRVDPDALEAMASSLSSAADSGPEAGLPALDDCGSSSVASAFDESGGAFRTAWRQATDEAAGLSVGAMKAAENYRRTEAVVALRSTSKAF